MRAATSFETWDNQSLRGAEINEVHLLLVSGTRSNVRSALDPGANLGLGRLGSCLGR
jgi:hypothetical protein